MIPESDKYIEVHIWYKTLDPKKGIYIQIVVNKVKKSGKNKKALRYYDHLVVIIWKCVIIIVQCTYISKYLPKMNWVIFYYFVFNPVFWLRYWTIWFSNINDFKRFLTLILQVTYWEIYHQEREVFYRPQKTSGTSEEVVCTVWNKLYSFQRQNKAKRLLLRLLISFLIYQYFCNIIYIIYLINLSFNIISLYSYKWPHIIKYMYVIKNNYKVIYKKKTNCVYVRRQILKHYYQRSTFWILSVLICI